MIINKLRNGLIGALLALTVLLFGGVALAADLDWSSDTTVVVNGHDYIIQSGSEATSMVINPTTLVVEVPALSTFTLSSEAGFTLANDQAVDETCSGAQSTIAYTGAGTITVTPTTIRVCADETGGGGGGGSSKKKTTTTPKTTTTTTTTTAPSANASTTALTVQEVLSLRNAGFTTSQIVAMFGGAQASSQGVQSSGGVAVVSGIRPGTNGAGTTAWQTALQNAGFNPGPIDGLWGPKTEAAVKAFQAAHGLTVDGWPGAMTAAKMNSL